jgi:tRNA-dihydrouridine synthase B
MNFWQLLNKPIIGLSPMDGITDAPFRHIVATVSQPSVLFTEFANVKGLWHGDLVVYQRLLFDKGQNPIVAQVFGSDPDYFYKIAHIICELGFDGLDINMGCPADCAINSQGGAALITNPALAHKIISQAQQGVADWAAGQTLADIGLDPHKIRYIENHRLDFVENGLRRPIPISVKTRIGFKENTVNEWISELIETKPELITIHGRIFKQRYSGTADWDAIGSQAEKIHRAGIMVLGNGDIKSLAEGKEKALHYGLDGVLIGRTACGNPWVFTDIQPKVEQKLHTAIKHTQYHVKILGDISFNELKKHLGWYCKGFDGAKELRTQLMAAQNVVAVETIISTFLGGSIPSILQ